MEENSEKNLSQLLQRYSFEDIVRSFFALNLWLPNVSSQTKSQYIYSVLESVIHRLQPDNKISTYQNFEDFIQQLLPLIPSFAMMEDYLPENDWGEIKYFINDKAYKIFYGGDLENPYDFIYAFEIQHGGFDDFYKKTISRSPIHELEFCLSIQDEIINNIDRSVQDFSELELAALNLPSESFWNKSCDFLQSFDPYSVYEKEMVDEYSKDVEANAAVPMPDLGAFQQAVHDGTNCPYFFYKKSGRIFPVLPRKYLAVLFDKWGKIFQNSSGEMKSQVDNYEAKMSLQLFGFMRQRTQEKDLFAFVSAINDDMSPHETLFTSAFRSKDKIVLIHMLPPPTPESTQQQIFDSFVPALKEVQALLSKAPTRLGLRAQRHIVQFESTHKQSDSLQPLIISVLPLLTTASGIVYPPEELVGEIIGLDQFLAIFDEVEDLNEFADFFDYVNSMRDSGIPMFSSLLDRFGSFKDSHSVLIEGASNPDMIWLDPHWGSSFRYRALLDFWSVYPEENFFGNPRSWIINKKALKTNTVILKSKTFFGYVYCLRLGASYIFINSPVNLLTFDQGRIADSLMHCLEDSFTIYSDLLKGLPFAVGKRKIHVLFFPRTLVESNPDFEHIEHLVPASSSLWAMDTTRLKNRDYGIRIVFDDVQITAALQDAKDRSLQVSLLQAVLSEMNEVFGGDDGTVHRRLDEERAQKNRFRMFKYDKKASFPEHSNYVVAETRELKLADKKVAEIGKANVIAPGKYDGTEAKHRVNILKDGLLNYLNQRVGELDMKSALPIILSNIDSLTNEHERNEALVEDSMDQDVDYQRAEFAGKSKQTYIHNHKNYRYLIEKLVQLQPAGNKYLIDTELAEIFALVDRLLLLYAVSDFLHYGIHPARIEITDDFLVNINYGSDIDSKIKAGAEEQAKIRLGIIGNSEDSVSIPDEFQRYIDELNKAFEKDLGFSLRDIMDVHQILMTWPIHNESVSEATFYRAMPEEVIGVCSMRMDDTHPTKLKSVLNFLTLDPNKILLVEGRAAIQPDVPVWEHRKKTMRYSIRPLVKIESHYYWAAHSIERSGRLWSGIIGTSKLPSDINAPTVANVLQKGHDSVAERLQEKIEVVAKRYTPYVETEVFPHLQGLIVEDIGDIDVFVFLKTKNIILNIESKIIDQGFCNKDLKRIAEKIFGRTKSDGSFEEGYLHRVLKRDELLKRKGKELAERYWGPLPAQPLVISIFVTQTSYWWTKYPIIESNVHFVELALLDDLIKSLCK